MVGSVVFPPFAHGYYLDTARDQAVSFVFRPLFRRAVLAAVILSARTF